MGGKKQKQKKLRIMPALTDETTTHCPENDSVLVEMLLSASTSSAGTPGTHRLVRYVPAPQVVTLHGSGTYAVPTACTRATSATVVSASKNTRG